MLLVVFFFVLFFYRLLISGLVPGGPRQSWTMVRKKSKYTCDL